MECTRCEKELERHEIVHDYMGNEWCEECLNEETERKLDEHFKPFEDFEKAKTDFVDALAKTFKIDKIAKWLNDKLEGVK